MYDVFLMIVNRLFLLYMFFDVWVFEDVEFVVNEVMGKGFERVARRWFREADIVLDYYFGKFLLVFIE